MKTDTAGHKNIIMLPLNTFKTVIASTPLISIDLIVRNNKQQILLGKRLNRPAQGFWFVPGGRILKDEPLESAFKRLIKVELGVGEQVLQNHNSTFKGIYQHFYNDNVTGNDFSTHYVVLAYEITLTNDLSSLVNALPKEQHNEYKWLTETELLNHKHVHKHTKWYFQEGQNADASFTK